MHNKSLRLLCILLLCSIAQTATAQTSAKPSAEVTVKSSNAACRKPLLVSEFGEEGEESELSRLDLFTTYLQNSPESSGYVVVYGARRGKRGEVRVRGARIKKYLVDNRSLHAVRIAVVHGGFREKLTIQLWLRQPDAYPPLPTPTVDLEDVLFKGKNK